MANFMIPRYIRSVAELPLTPSQKIEKHVLRTQGITADTWDREAAGMRLQRTDLSQRTAVSGATEGAAEAAGETGAANAPVASSLADMSRPLRDLKVLEFAGLDPAPFCCMLLADMGAEVTRIDRPGTIYKPEDVEARGRKSIQLDLKTQDGRTRALALIEATDIVIEGFRPGVMERLGLGPDVAMARNPRLIYGRMTGWGQSGPQAHKAGHDLNYLALSGALHALGAQEKPAVPLSLIADFGGGALYLAMGVLAALHHVRQGGPGQVIDCAMTDGVISLLAMIYGDLAAGSWTDARESNVIDGAAHFYNVYRCADGKWLSLAAIEPQFYMRFLEAADLHDAEFRDQWNRSLWPLLKSKLERFFAARTRDEWSSHFAPFDVCVEPVLSLREAQQHPHNVARGAFIVRDGISQPAPAPRFSLANSGSEEPT